MFGYKKYYSFLLRMWQPLDSDRSEWNYSLENTMTREIQNFQDSQSLTQYLTQIINKTQVESEQNNKEET